MNSHVVRQISVDIFVERYSLSFRQTTFTVNLHHEARPSILSLELHEITTCVPQNTVLSHIETRRLSSQFSELRNRSKRELKRTQMSRAYCVDKF